MTALAPSPASLFFELWAIAEAWAPSDRARATKVDAKAHGSLRAMLHSSERAAHDDLYKEVERYASQNSAEARGHLLAIMEAIDFAFLIIHPRTPTLPRTFKRPDWLVDAREERLLTGVYFKSSTHALVPRGPLTRAARGPRAASADELADRFAALSVVPLILTQSNRNIEISLSIVASDVARGVAPPTNPGGETVAFVPVAEVEKDLLVESVNRLGRSFVEFKVPVSVNPTDRIIGVLNHVGHVDIAIAPELVVSEKEADLLARSMGQLLNEPPRIVIAGSGVTNEKVDGQPWNEARVLNGNGAELWRQRKIWPAGLDRNRGLALGLPDPGSDDLIYEDTASGNEVFVADVEGFGRCIILICQDLKARPLASDLIRHFQPDWVFTPVLDRDVSVGRWAHQEAFALSDISQARFLVATSTSLGSILNAGDRTCGLAVGPKEPAPGASDPSRAVVAVAAITGSSPAYAKVIWRSGDWKQTAITAT